MISKMTQNLLQCHQCQDHSRFGLVLHAVTAEQGSNTYHFSIIALELQHGLLRERLYRSARPGTGGSERTCHLSTPYHPAKEA